MMAPVFLSASIPDPLRHERYCGTADNVAIREAVRALAMQVLPRTELVFGGHPAISPLILQIAQRLRRMSRVIIYQSAFFASALPSEARAFKNLILVPEVDRDRSASLKAMREAMIRSKHFGAGVFIGGMEGVEEEFEIFRRIHAEAAAHAVASTGAAAKLIFDRCRSQAPNDEALANNHSYTVLFSRLLSGSLSRQDRRRRRS